MPGFFVVVVVSLLLLGIRVQPGIFVPVTLFATNDKCSTIKKLLMQFIPPHHRHRLVMGHLVFFSPDISRSKCKRIAETSLHYCLVRAMYVFEFGCIATSLAYTHT